MSKKISFLAISLLCTSLMAEAVKGTSAAGQAPAPTVAAPTGNAQAPTLQINGFTAIVAGKASQQDNTNGKGGGPHLAIGSSNIYFTAKGSSASGFNYKYRGALESYPGGKSVSGGNGSIYFTQNYIEFSQDSWGIFQVGNLTGPEDTLVESGFNLLQGANTIDGTFTNIVNFAEGVIEGVQMVGQTSKATKVAYYTPGIQVGGSPTAGVITLGIAFTPNTTRFGMGGIDNSGATPDNAYGNNPGLYPDKSIAAYGVNNISLGANYKVDFKTWNLALAAVYIQEKAKRGNPRWVENQNVNGVNNGTLEFFKIKKAHHTRSTQFTAAVGSSAWRFATGLILNNRARLPKTSSYGYKAGDAGTAWNVAGQYTIGAYQFALGYFNTSRKLPNIPGNAAGNPAYGAVSGRATSDIVSATIDFNALQGLKFFGEVDVFKMRTNANYAKFIGNTKNYTDKSIVPTVKNSGAAVIVGTKLSF